MHHYLLAGLYLLTGFAFLLGSGASEGLGSPRIILFILAPVAVVLAAVQLFRLVVRRGWHGMTGLEAVAAVLMIVCILQGLETDDAAIDETKQRGELLIAEIARFEQAEGRCPHDLAELATTGVDPSRPTVKGPEFFYYVNQSGECTIGYHGPLFITCSLDTGDTDWFCD